MVQCFYDTVHRPAVIGLAILSFGTICLAAPAYASGITSQDIAFIRVADQAELGDVKLAALALHKSDDRRVVSFATRIRDVDAQLHVELGAIAAAQHVSFPSFIGSSYKRRLHELSEDSRPKFNTGYLKFQLRADQQLLSVYKWEAAKGTNVYVTAFAKQTIPVLDQHIWLARRGIAALGKRPTPLVPRTGM